MAKFIKVLNYLGQHSGLKPGTILEVDNITVIEGKNESIDVYLEDGTYVYLAGGNGTFDKEYEVVEKDN